MINFIGIGGMTVGSAALWSMGGHPALLLWSGVCLGAMLTTLLVLEHLERES